LFVHLHREDLLAQAVSAHFAEVTGQWGADDTITTRPQNFDFFDFDRIAITMELLADEDRHWRVFFAKNGIVPLRVSYEQLCADPHAVLSTISHQLGLPLETLSYEYDEREAYGETASGRPKKAEVKRQFLQAQRSLRSINSRGG
jgi:LPS sulfotransferase NodH